MPLLSPVAEKIAARLIERRETIAVTESSTGGLIAAALLAVPGASAFFLGGAVAYTRAARLALLGIGDADMKGLRPSTEAYSLMIARRVRERHDATWAIGETGATGPTGNRYGDAAGQASDDPWAKEVAFVEHHRRDRIVVRGTFAGHYVDADDERPDFFHLFAIADSADVILVSSYVAHSSTVTTLEVPRSFVDFIEELCKRKEHPIVIAFGNPYLLQQIPDVGAYVVAWGGFPVSQGAAARALLGTIPMTGKLPITIPGPAEGP